MCIVYKDLSLHHSPQMPQVNPLDENQCIYTYIVQCIVYIYTVHSCLGQPPLSSSCLVMVCENLNIYRGQLEQHNITYNNFYRKLEHVKMSLHPSSQCLLSPSAWSWYIRTWDSEHLNIDGGQLSWPFYFLERLLLRASCWSSILARLCKCASVPKKKYTNANTYLSVSFHGKVVAHNKLLVKHPG